MEYPFLTFLLAPSLKYPLWVHNTCTDIQQTWALKKSSFMYLFFTTMYRQFYTFYKPRSSWCEICDNISPLSNYHKYTIYKSVIFEWVLKLRSYFRLSPSRYKLPKLAIYRVWTGVLSINLTTKLRESGTATCNLVMCKHTWNDIGAISIRCLRQRVDIDPMSIQDIKITIEFCSTNRLDMISLDQIGSHYSNHNL